MLSLRKAKQRQCDEVLPLFLRLLCNREQLFSYHCHATVMILNTRLCLVSKENIRVNRRFISVYVSYISVGVGRRSEKCSQMVTMMKLKQMSILNWFFHTLIDSSIFFMEDIPQHQGIHHSNLQYMVMIHLLNHCTTYCKDVTKLAQIQLPTFFLLTCGMIFWQHAMFFQLDLWVGLTQKVS